MLKMENKQQKKVYNRRENKGSQRVAGEQKDDKPVSGIIWDSSK